MYENPDKCADKTLVQKKWKINLYHLHLGSLDGKEVSVYIGRIRKMLSVFLFHTSVVQFLCAKTHVSKFKIKTWGIPPLSLWDLLKTKYIIFQSCHFHEGRGRSTCSNNSKTRNSAPVYIILQNRYILLTYLYYM